jgi:4-hydroxythreonine-4-phosphate dehydrogenase
MTKRLRVAVTQGDAAGIGPEVLVKALAREEFRGLTRAIGCPETLAHEARRAGVAPPHEIVGIRWPGAGPPEAGKPSPDTGVHALACLRAAVRMARAGEVDGIVTGPVSKEMLGHAGVTHPGQTELLAEMTETRQFLMTLVAGDLRVAVVTTHVPIKRVAELISIGAIVEKLRVLDGGLRELFAIRRPRIAVLALNPHAGDGGRCGTEEADVIAPAVREAADKGIHVTGPLSADGAFATWERERWDAILAMFHDQGLAPFKARSFGRGVNVTLGLPLIRTSPDHGTAYDIAGRGTADDRSMTEAVRLALHMAAARRNTRRPSQ